MEDSLRAEVWQGCIPVELTLDQREVTSLYAPHPLYMLLPRMSYLPCYASEVDEHFGDAAAEARRTIWFEDSSTGQPIRWHLPIGVLHDMRAAERKCLPWRLTVHFHRFPHKQVIPFEDENAVHKHFMNSMKQALYLQHNSAKVGMSLAKAVQLKMWESLKANDGVAFASADIPFDDVKRVPVRICIEGRPPIQMPIPPVLPNDQNAATTIRDCIRLSHREGLDDTTLLAYSNVLIQGMRVPLGTPVVKAWQLLQHPDRFLYVVLQPAAAVTSVS